MKLKWVTFKVSDLRASLTFYSELLGLEIAAQFGSPEHQIAMLGEKDQPKIELIFEPDATVEHPGHGVSVGLEPDHLDQLVHTLQEHGYQLQGPVSPNPQIRFFFVQDPDGYTVQLVEQKA